MNIEADKVKKYKKHSKSKTKTIKNRFMENL